MVTSRKKLDFWFWVKVVVIGFMLIFLIYPFCTLITRSFFSNKTAGFTFENYIRFFTKKYYYSALGRSLFVSIVTHVPHFWWVFRSRTLCPATMCLAKTSFTFLSS